MNNLNFSCCLETLNKKSTAYIAVQKKKSLRKERMEGGKEYLKHGAELVAHLSILFMLQEFWYYFHTSFS